MMRKLFVSAKNVDMVNGILESFGYESDLRVVNGRQYGGIAVNGQHARLTYGTFEGFYVTVSGTWLNSSEGIQEYLKELREVDRVISMLEANIESEVL